MAGVTQEVWASARYLYENEALGKERGAGMGFLGVTGGRTARDRSALSGLDGSQSASGRARGVKKNGKQAIGKSRGGGLVFQDKRLGGGRPDRGRVWVIGWARGGGRNTKINALAAGDRIVVGFSLSSGNAVDAGGGGSYWKRQDRVKETANS
jgi:hypothetical protein